MTLPSDDQLIFVPAPASAGPFGPAKCQQTNKKKKKNMQEPRQEGVGKRKRYAARREGPLVCQHEKCSHAKGGQRHVFKRGSSVHKHERTSVGHNCSEACATCAKIKAEGATVKRAKNCGEGWRCRHQECNRSYPTEKQRDDHEKRMAHPKCRCEFICLPRENERQNEEQRHALMELVKKKDVTTYKHIFVFHFGYFLERYGCLERFANFGIENMHACNKRVIISATNGFAGLDEGQSTLAKQLLTHSRRVRAFRAASASRGDLSSAFEAALNSLDKERNKKETWAVRNVEQWPDLKEKGYLPSDV
jgi:hypothetical protein